MGIYREHVEVQLLLPALEQEVERLKAENTVAREKTGRNNDECVWRINVVQRIQQAYKNRTREFDGNDKRRYEEVVNLLEQFDQPDEIYRVYLSDDQWDRCRRTTEEYREWMLKQWDVGEVVRDDFITVIDETARILGILSVSRVLTREDYDMVVAWKQR